MSDAQPNLKVNDRVVISVSGGSVQGTILSKSGMRIRVMGDDGKSRWSEVKNVVSLVVGEEVAGGANSAALPSHALATARSVVHSGANKAETQQEVDLPKPSKRRTSVTAALASAKSMYVGVADSQGKSANAPSEAVNAPDSDSQEALNAVPMRLRRKSLLASNAGLMKALTSPNAEERERADNQAKSAALAEVARKEMIEAEEGSGVAQAENTTSATGSADAAMENAEAEAAAAAALEAFSGAPVAAKSYETVTTPSKEVPARLRRKSMLASNAGLMKALASPDSEARERADQQAKADALADIAREEAKAEEIFKQSTNGEVPARLRRKSVLASNEGLFKALQAPTSLKVLRGTDFEGAAGTPGMELFRCRNRKLKRAAPNDPTLSGCLYSKDCYLVIVTSPAGGGRKGNVWRIMTWMGKEAGMILSGFCGSMAEKLNNLLASSSNPRDITMDHCVSGSESEEFRAALGGSLTHIDGNCEVPDDTPKVLVEKKAVRLMMIVEGIVVRVAAHVDSLRSDRTFVLDAVGSVYSWTGSNASRIERAVVEELTRRIIKKEYKVENENKRIAPIHISENESGPDFDAFTQVLTEKGQSFWVDTEKATEYALRARLYKVVENELEPVGFEAPQDWLDGSTADRGCRLSIEYLELGCVFVVDCFSELFIWLGRGHSKSDEQAAKKLCKSFCSEASRPEWIKTPVVVKDRMETVVFRERFYGWTDDDLEIHSNLKYKHDKEKTAIAMRPITGEVMRMISGGVGSIEAENDMSDQWLKGDVEVMGDNTRGLKLSLADDQEAVLRVFQTGEDGLLHALEPEKFGIFSSSEMYVIVYSCKMGSLNVVYTWEGKMASLSARTATGLRVQTLMNDLKAASGSETVGAQHQIYVQQNAEPPLLVAIFHSRSIPLIVHRSRPKGGYMRKDDGLSLCGSDSSGGEVRIFQIHGNVRKLCVIEQPVDTVRSTGMSGCDCYVILRRQTSSSSLPGTASLSTDFCQPGAVCILKWFGPESSDEHRALADRVALAGTLPAICDLAEPLSPVSNLNDSPHICPFLDINPSSVPPLPPTTRPIRLFNVSHAKRQVGAMFVEEIGGGYFNQDDLFERGTFILDSGSTHLWVWFGDGALSQDECELAVRVAIRLSRYIKQMKYYIPADLMKTQNVVTGLKQVSKGGGRDAVECPPITVELCESGREPANFKACFFGWQDTKGKDKYVKMYDKYLAENLDEPASDDEAAKTLRAQEQQQQASERRVSTGGTPVEGAQSEKLARLSFYAGSGTKPGALVNGQAGRGGRGSMGRGGAGGRSSGGALAKKVAGRTLTIEERLGGVTKAGRRGSIHMANASQPLKFNQDTMGLSIVMAQLHAKELNWVAYGYTSKQELSLLGSGKDGLTGAVGALTETTVAYATVRFEVAELKSHGVDSSTDRYLLVQWVPASSSPLVRGAVNAHRAAVHEVFSPHHLQVNADDKSDLELSAVIEQFKNARIQT